MAAGGRPDDEDTDGHALNYYDNLPDNACAIAEEIAVYHTYCVWREQRTPAEHRLLDLLAPAGEDLTLADAAPQLDTSIATLHRRRKHLRDDLVAFLKAG